MAIQVYQNDGSVAASYAWITDICPVSPGGCGRVHLLTSTGLNRVPADPRLPGTIPYNPNPTSPDNAPNMVDRYFFHCRSDLQPSTPAIIWCQPVIGQAVPAPVAAAVSASNVWSS